MHSIPILCETCEKTELVAIESKILIVIKRPKIAQFCFLLRKTNEEIAFPYIQFAVKCQKKYEIICTVEVLY